MQWTWPTTGSHPGTGSVKIEEMDASNAEPPVHTGKFSERKRKSSAAVMYSKHDLKHERN